MSQPLKQQTVAEPAAALLADEARNPQHETSRCGRKGGEYEGDERQMPQHGHRAAV